MIFCLFPYSQLVVLTLPVSCQSDSGSQAELRLKWPLAHRVCVRSCLCSCGVCAYTLRGVGVRRLRDRTWAIGQGDKWTVSCWCCTKNVRSPHAATEDPRPLFSSPHELLPLFFVFRPNPWALCVVAASTLDLKLAHSEPQSPGPGHTICSPLSPSVSVYVCVWLWKYVFTSI